MKYPNWESQFGTRLSSPDKISPKSILIGKYNVKFLLGEILLGEVNRAHVVNVYKISLSPRFGYLYLMPANSIVELKTTHRLPFHNIFRSKVVKISKNVSHVY